jgi:hypothetical protein
MHAVGTNFAEPPGAAAMLKSQQLWASHHSVCAMMLIMGRALSSRANILPMYHEGSAERFIRAECACIEHLAEAACLSVQPGWGTRHIGMIVAHDVSLKGMLGRTPSQQFVVVGWVACAVVVARFVAETQRAMTGFRAHAFLRRLSHLDSSAILRCG